MPAAYIVGTYVPDPLHSSRYRTTERHEHASRDVQYRCTNREAMFSYVTGTSTTGETMAHLISWCDGGGGRRSRSREENWLSGERTDICRRGVRGRLRGGRGWAGGSREGGRRAGWRLVALRPRANRSSPHTKTKRWRRWRSALFTGPRSICRMPTLRPVLRFPPSPGQ